jgi:hypothetical protein
MNIENILENIVLVRLLVNKEPLVQMGIIKRDIAPLFINLLSDMEIKNHIEKCLERLKDNSFITLTKRKTSSLTTNGQKKALSFLCLDQLPVDIKWMNIKKLYLPAIALNSSDNHDYLKYADNFRSTALKVLYDLSLNNKATLRQTTDALLAKQLKPSKSGLDAIKNALIKTWIENQVKEKETLQNDEIVDVELDHIIEFNPVTFVKDVLNAAKECETGKFGDKKVFISHVWKIFANKHPEYDLDEKSFKSKLTKHARKHLSRADLISAMDQNDVRASETTYLNATFHFIILE